MNDIPQRLQKEDLLIITANKSYLYKGLKLENYRVYNPYIEHCLLERLLREVSFRTFSFLKKIWYNKEILKEHPQYVMVWDPLITAHYLNWLKLKFPYAQFNLIYGNMIGKARHLNPEKVPSFVRKWTYDAYDSRKYKLFLFDNSAYFRGFIKPNKELVYDILFVGKDKGRSSYLFEIEKRFKELGLKTKFLIVKDGMLARNKPYYSKALEYEEIVDLIIESKAILNVTMENQVGMTIRDLECLFFEKKLITTNKNATNMDMYYPQNVFVLDGLNTNGIINFLKTPFTPYPDDIKNRHTFETFFYYVVSK